MTCDDPGSSLSNHDMPTLNRFSTRPSLLKLPTALFLSMAAITPSHGQPTREPLPRPASLQSCAGRYQASPDTIITVRPHGVQLTLEVNSGSPMDVIQAMKQELNDINNRPK
jgi:hypothetical protein